MIATNSACVLPEILGLPAFSSPIVECLRPW